jgi:LmbE family N-acetylglucosaminyl deacetylase
MPYQRMNGLYIPESALVIAAHPDDIELACAGTLARWARGGAELVYVLVTSGEAGIEDPSCGREEAMALREAEQRAAAAIVGVQEVVFLREPDGLLAPTLELRRKLVREIRRCRPEVIVCGDPTLFWMGPSLNHPDHRAVAAAALEAAWPTAGRLNVWRELEAEGCYAHGPRHVFVTGVTQEGANFHVDIGLTLEVKLAALRAHVSQMRGSDPSPELHRWATANARGQGMEYAESFRVVTLMNDERWAKTRGRKE